MKLRQRVFKPIPWLEVAEPKLEPTQTIRPWLRTKGKWCSWHAWHSPQVTQERLWIYPFHKRKNFLEGRWLHLKFRICKALRATGKPWLLYCPQDGPGWKMVKHGLYMVCICCRPIPLWKQCHFSPLVSLWLEPATQEDVTWFPFSLCIIFLQRNRTNKLCVCVCERVYVSVWFVLGYWFIQLWKQQIQNPQGGWANWRPRKIDVAVQIQRPRAGRISSFCSVFCSMQLLDEVHTH